MNPTTEAHCSQCGHDAHRARLQCQCPACNQLRYACASDALTVGERVILTVPDPQQDGRRGTVQDAHPGEVYDVLFDDSTLVMAWIGRNRLEREADCPDYPLPKT